MSRFLLYYWWVFYTSHPRRTGQTTPVVVNGQGVVNQPLYESDVSADLVNVILLLGRLEVKFVDVVGFHVLHADNACQRNAAWEGGQRRDKVRGGWTGKYKDSRLRLNDSVVIFMARYLIDKHTGHYKFSQAYKDTQKPKE